MTSPIEPSFPAPKKRGSESAPTASLISALKLEPHIEGGYFVETDRDPLRVPNPFPSTSEDDKTRSASTSIYYLLTPQSPQGHFHRNKGRTVHTLHKGRGRYVLIHADEVGEGNGKGRIETFVVGHDVQKGERLQWIVEGGKYKASFLLPDAGGDSSEGLLISETVVPGFEYQDHDFLTVERFKELVTEEQAKELEWLVRKD